jgi:plasmid stabilization system protein ParE
MKVIYLRSALPDLVWMRRYYSRVFPQGAKQAQYQLNATKRLISEHPEIGHLAIVEGLLEFPVLKTPFTIVYRIRPSRIEILRIRDQRQSPDRLRS